MWKKYFNYLLFLSVVLLAVITRGLYLGDAPAGFYVDEAGQGYSAYSILKTGKDEFGKAFPIVFRSLTDFKTPVYIYSIVPLIPIFGLSPFTVRLPSFIFSIATIPILYLLVKRLSGNQNLAVISIVLLSISPWHILFGRTNFECNVALFFYLSGILSFYKSLDKPKYLLLSAFLFGIAIPAYHSQRVITPLTMLILFLKYRNNLLSKSHFRFLIGGLIIGLAISLPTVSIMHTPGFLARASGLNIFSHSRQMPDGFIAEYKGFLEPLVNGSWYLSAREFFALYFSYLSPRFMFALGDYGPRSSFPELSTHFMWQFPFYLFGLWTIFTKKQKNNLDFLVILMLLVSPIPAAVTRDPYTTIRALPLVIPQLIIISYGILDTHKFLYKVLPKKMLTAFLCFLVMYSLTKLYSSGIILNEFYRAKYWDWGWEVVTNTIKNLDPQLPIVVDNARSDPDLQIAFFMKYPPEKYQRENFEVNTDSYYTDLKRNPQKHVGNITTRAIVWREDLKIDQYLIGDELGISEQQIKNHKLELVKEIKYPDGTIAYRIVRTNPEWEKYQSETAPTSRR